MEIDPEVAALLEEGLGVTLPPALVKKGWGQTSMHQAHNIGTGQMVTPSQEFQPQYTDTCHQCGRPITLDRQGGWADHAYRTNCDGALVDRALTMYHFPTSQLDDIKAWVKRENSEMMRRLEVEKEKANQRRKEIAARQAAPCGHSKHSSSCQHQCSQGGDHFGFHECKFCRHLWK